VESNNRRSQQNPSSKAQALLAKIRESNENIEALQQLWETLIGEPVPEDRQFRIWLNRYGFDIVAQSIEALAEWVSKNSQALAKIEEEEHREPTDEELRKHNKSLISIIQYVSGIMKRKASTDGSDQAYSN
jgi:hypothetical protein